MDPLDPMEGCSSYFQEEEQVSLGAADDYPQEDLDCFGRDQEEDYSEEEDLCDWSAGEEEEGEEEEGPKGDVESQSK